MTNFHIDGKAGLEGYTLMELTILNLIIDLLAALAYHDGLGKTNSMKIKFSSQNGGFNEIRSASPLLHTTVPDHSSFYTHLSPQVVTTNLPLPYQMH